MKKTQTVDGFLAQLKHKRLADIKALRRVILGSDPRVSEQVKWNAPSFCWQGDDRVTMRLHPGDRLQLIFHRGARTKDASGFKFSDPAGLIEWAAPDRGVLTVHDISAQRELIIALVKAWMVATAAS